MFERSHGSIYAFLSAKEDVFNVVISSTESQQHSEMSPRGSSFTRCITYAAISGRHFLDRDIIVG